MRRSLREQTFQDNRCVEETSPKSGGTKQAETLSLTQIMSYNRRLVTQRFTHRGITTNHNEDSSLKLSETARDRNILPRLNLKSRDHKRGRNERSGGGTMK